MTRSRANAETMLEPRREAHDAEPRTPRSAETPKLSPRSTKGVRTRERLVEAAKEIFEEHGFLSARISDIAERAGQSHGSFYYYFDSKEEIFREVAASVDKHLFAPLDEVILAEMVLPSHQRVREAMRRHLESFRKEARMLSLIEHVSRFDAEVNALRLARHKAFTVRVAEIIRRLQRRKLADTKLDPEITAAALGALTHRFAEMWFVHGAVDCSMKDGVEQLSRLFVNAVKLKEPEPKA
jgi:AcrR family transcriptional regulator